MPTIRVYSSSTVMDGRLQTRSVASIRRRVQAEAFADVGPVVYYVWRKGLVKIGHSTELRKRMYALDVKPHQLLAVERGSIDLERSRHIEFVAHRIHGEELGVEHYWPSKPLLDHINAIREQLGQPVLVVGLRERK